MTQTVYRVDKVTVAIGKSMPPALIIVVDGTASSAGWTNFTLSKHIYTHWPEDGVQGYDLVGDEPGDDLVHIEVLTPFQTTHTEPLEDRVKGVRIHAATNMIEATVP